MAAPVLHVDAMTPPRPDTEGAEDAEDAEETNRRDRRGAEDAEEFDFLPLPLSVLCDEIRRPPLPLRPTMKTEATRIP